MDDAHWADESSLRFLAYLARRAESLPVALLVGARPEEDPGAGGPLSELRADPATDVLEPAPLDAAGVQRVLVERSDGMVDAAFARACHEATGGNPSCSASSSARWPPSPSPSPRRPPTACRT